MRIICKTIDDYLENLKKAHGVHLDTVRVSIDKAPTTGTRYDATKFAVTFQSSAVVNCVDGSQHLLEVGLDCGYDIEDADPDRSGSHRAECLKAYVVDLAGERNWGVMPGIIEA